VSSDAAAPALRVAGVEVRFGGLTAVSDVSLEVRPGQAVGLVGPNGAGKTTTFNCCSGLVRPTRGGVELFGNDVTAKAPAERAQLGLGRTFQRMELYERLTVEQNVAMGLEARLAGSRRLGAVLGTRAEKVAVAQASEGALARCGITHLAKRRAGVLPSGLRRLVELARALAGGFRLLLLDEPSSGLDPGETAGFGQILRDVIADGRTSLLLVEHDMSLVRAVCGYTYVLDFGKLIAEGGTEDVLSSATVRAAYLGEDEVA
jgi:ABC-type branched-subunit amino acid transport system ATPase component